MQAFSGIRLLQTCRPSRALVRSALTPLATYPSSPRHSKKDDPEHPKFAKFSQILQYTRKERDNPEHSVFARMPEYFKTLENKTRQSRALIVCQNVTILQSSRAEHDNPEHSEFARNAQISQNIRKTATQGTQHSAILSSCPITSSQWHEGNAAATLVAPALAH